MSEDIKVDNKVDTTKNDKLFADLKKKADLLGVKYSTNIGFEKLKLKVELFLEEKDETVKTTKSVGPNKSVIDLETEAKKPMLVIVKDLDATQQNDPTIVTNIVNKYFKIGCITQKDKEQLVPAAVVEAIRAKTMVQMVDEKHALTKRPTGNKVARTTARYNVMIIDENPGIK
jgi:hypothetical protein